MPKIYNSNILLTCLKWGALCYGLMMVKLLSSGNLRTALERHWGNEIFELLPVLGELVLEHSGTLDVGFVLEP
jgi:hypothetical protein